MSRQLRIQPIHTSNLKKLNWTKPFPVNGQGVLVFNIMRSKPFSIVARLDKDVQQWISLEVQDKWAAFHIKKGANNPTKLREVANSAKKNVGYEADKIISYWFSYDRDNLILKYGKGYRMNETVLMTYDFLKGLSPEQIEQKKEELKDFFSAEKKLICEQYDTDPQSDCEKRPARKKKKEDPILNQSLNDIEGMVEFDLNPLICNRPYLVKDSSEISLFSLDEGDFTFSASLPAGCRVLYENVKNCKLNWPEETEDVLLSDAMRYSINTSGCLLYEKLQAKAHEFGKKADPRETYLRVTLGCSLGKSPGIPYVLELWPSKHYSPIHNHGNANAVIKVLFGSIHVQVYNKQVQCDEDSGILLQFDGKPGDVTWINRNWYQTHKLVNKSDDFCATIQCYNYDLSDMTHWPYFDYVGDCHDIEEFTPDSDFTFRDMRTKVMEEYRQSIDKRCQCEVTGA